MNEDDPMSRPKVQVSRSRQQSVINKRKKEIVNEQVLCLPKSLHPKIDEKNGVKVIRRRKKIDVPNNQRSTVYPKPTVFPLQDCSKKRNKNHQDQNNDAQSFKCAEIAKT
jgi:hypothetical protein